MASLFNLLLIALGGAMGALFRYGISISAHGIFGKAFPYGTLIANIIGCFLMGFLFIFISHLSNHMAHYRNFLLIGFLGALTTFSTFSMESLLLLKDGRLGLGMLNMGLNLFVCLLAVWLGFILGNKLC